MLSRRCGLLEGFPPQLQQLRNHGRGTLITAPNLRTALGDVVLSECCLRLDCENVGEESCLVAEERKHFKLPALISFFL